MNQFLDTNVLLYAYDTSAGEKHRLARELVLRLARSGEAVISLQVMQEFYVNAVMKIAKPLTPEQAKLRLEAFSQWLVHSPLPADVISAVEIAGRDQLSFWDAMIVLSAKKMNCEILWTEDLSPDRVIEQVQIRTPF